MAHAHSGGCNLTPSRHTTPLTTNVITQHTNYRTIYFGRVTSIVYIWRDCFRRQPTFRHFGRRRTYMGQNNTFLKSVLTYVRDFYKNFRAYCRPIKKNICKISTVYVPHEPTYGHSEVEKWPIFSCSLPILKFLSKSEFEILFDVQKKKFFVCLRRPYRPLSFLLELLLISISQCIFILFNHF